ncbi:hypothetical protein AVEN_127702-1, partial [Araneus ventricosus]
MIDRFVGSLLETEAIQWAVRNGYANEPRSDDEDDTLASFALRRAQECQ